MTFIRLRALQASALLVCLVASSACTGAWVATGVAAVGAAGALYSDNRNEVPDEGPYFYRGTDVGTDAYAGPFDVLLNKGFATAQWEGHGRDIFTYPYGWERTVRAITHVDEAMANSGGWSTTLRRELVPFSQDGWNSWAWVPNYYGHVIEGGIAFRRLREWFESRGVARGSAVLAGLTTWSAAFINEAYEGAGHGPPHGGTAMDLLVFDIGGILLFNQDPVARFFSRNLRASVWPTQASLLLNDGRLINNAHHLVVKLPVFFTDRFSLFLKSGIGFAAGVSVHAGDGLDISVGVGQESRKRFIDPETRLETAEFGSAAGLWVDRRGILLASLLVDEYTDRRLALNIYPGVSTWLGDLGVWVALDHEWRPAFGITARQALGLGIGLGF